MKKISKLKEIPRTINTRGDRASNTEEKKKLKTYTDFHFSGGLEHYLQKISNLSWQIWADLLSWNGGYWSRELWQPRSGAHCLRKAAYLWYLGLWSLWSWRYMITCWGKEFLFTEVRWVFCKIRNSAWDLNPPGNISQYPDTFLNACPPITNLSD